MRYVMYKKVQRSTKVPSSLHSAWDPGFVRAAFVTADSARKPVNSGKALFMNIKCVTVEI